MSRFPTGLPAPVLAVAAPYHTHHVVSPQDVLTAAGDVLELVVDGCNAFLIQAGFPCLLAFDGRPIGHGGQIQEQGAPTPVYTVFTQGLYRIREPAQTIRVRLPAGLGPEAEADAYARHGLLVIDGYVDPTMESLPLEPWRDLPGRTWIFTSGTIGANGTGDTILLSGTSFNVGNGAGARTPTQIWIHEIRARRLNASASADYTGKVLRVQMDREPLSPLGDLETVFDVHANDNPIVFSPSQPLRVDLKAYIDSWPVGAGGANPYEINLGVDPVAVSTTVQIRIMGTYRF